MLTINGVELEFDIFDLDTAEAYEDGMELVQKTAASAPKNKSLTDVIQVQCQAVFDFFDMVFGEGTSGTVFGNRMNLMHCLKAFEQVVKHVDLQMKEAEEIKNKYAKRKQEQGNRAQRRQVGRDSRQMGARLAND